MYSMNAARLLFVREWQRFLIEPSRIVGVLIQPLLFWLIMGAGLSPVFKMEGSADLSYADFFFPGMLALLTLFCSLFTTMTLIEDRNAGLMHGFLVAPCSRKSLVLGKIAGVCSIGFCQGLLVTLIGAALGLLLVDASFGLLIIVLILGNLFLAGLGFFIAWGTNSTSAYHVLMSAVLMPMWILSGAVFPLKNTWMQYVSYVNPMSWFVGGLHQALFQSGNGVVLYPFSITLTLLIVGTVIVLFAAMWVCEKSR